MALLDLPTELLLPTLGYLPVRSLLKFSQCSRHARSLANSSLHTLGLDFCSELHPWNTPLVSRRFLQLKLTARSSERIPQISNDRTELHFREDEHQNNVVVKVRDVNTYDYNTLANFQVCLASSILYRHYEGLRYLDFTVSVFVSPMAKAIAQLPVLRSLFINIVDIRCGKNLPISSVDLQRQAWRVLATSAVWRRDLRVLKIQNAALTTSDLLGLLVGNTHCHQLQLTDCKSIGNLLWDFLGGDWSGQSTLQVLAIKGCGGHLDESVLEAIGRLRTLQVRLVMRTCLEDIALTLCYSIWISKAALNGTRRKSKNGTTMFGTFQLSYNQGLAFSQGWMCLKLIPMTHTMTTNDLGQ